MPPPPPPGSRNPLRSLVHAKVKAPPPPPLQPSESSFTLGSSQLVDDFVRAGPSDFGGSYAIRRFVGKAIKEATGSKARLWNRRKTDEDANCAVSIKFNASLQMTVITEFNEDAHVSVTIPFAELGSVVIGDNPHLRLMSSQNLFTMVVGFASEKIRDEVHELTCAVRSCGLKGFELFQALDPGCTGFIPTQTVTHLFPRHLLEEHRVRQTQQKGYSQHGDISFWSFIIMLADVDPPRERTPTLGAPAANEAGTADSPLNQWINAQLLQTGTEISVTFPLDPGKTLESTVTLTPIKPEGRELEDFAETNASMTPLKFEEEPKARAVKPPSPFLDRYSLLAGEVVLHRRMYGEARFLYRNFPRLTAEEQKSNIGGLLLTSYQLVYVPCSRTLDCCSVPLAHINIVELDQDTITVTTKDLFVYKWAIASTVSEDLPRVGETPAEATFKFLYNLSFPIDPNLLFAFTSTRSNSAALMEPRRFHPELPTLESGGPPLDGWLAYDAMRDYERLGMFLRRGRSGNPIFRAFQNTDGRLSPTYPALFLIPSVLTDAELQKVAAHRSKGRVPAVVYMHPDTGATLARCSQPHVGLKGFVGGGNRCPEEEKLIEALISSNPTNQKTLYFVDLRRNSAASGNQLMGKGTEHVSYYRNTQLKFMGIGNIHAVRGAYEKLSNLCHTEAQQGDLDWDKKFYETHWLQHIRVTLHAASQMALILGVEGSSIVTHCSDGWDRTPAVVSLVEILLDPFYRTKRGFAILIEKEWCSFGHMFAERLGQGLPNHTSDQRAPVFFQWLECVFQILRQHPQEFEFTEDFLLGIASELTTCRYGTFLYDTERERREEDVRGRTASIWTDFLNDKAYPAFTNQGFYPTRITLAVDYTRRLVMWERYWLRIGLAKAPRQTRAEKEKETKELQQQQILADLRTKYQALEGFIKAHDASADVTAIAEGSLPHRRRGGNGAFRSAHTSPVRPCPLSPRSPRPRSGSADETNAAWRRTPTHHARAASSHLAEEVRKLGESIKSSLGSGGGDVLVDAAGSRGGSRRSCNWSRGVSSSSLLESVGEEAIRSSDLAEEASDDSLEEFPPLEDIFALPPTPPSTTSSPRSLSHSMFTVAATTTAPAPAKAVVAAAPSTITAGFTPNTAASTSSASTPVTTATSLTTTTAANPPPNAAIAAPQPTLSSTSASTSPHPAPIPLTIPAEVAGPPTPNSLSPTLTVPTPPPTPPPSETVISPSSTNSALSPSSAATASSSVSPSPSPTSASTTSAATSPPSSTTSSASSTPTLSTAVSPPPEVPPAASAPLPPMVRSLSLTVLSPPSPRLKPPLPSTPAPRPPNGMVRNASFSVLPSSVLPHITTTAASTTPPATATPSTAPITTTTIPAPAPNPADGSPPGGTIWNALTSLAATPPPPTPLASSATSPPILLAPAITPARAATAPPSTAPPASTSPASITSLSSSLSTTPPAAAAPPPTIAPPPSTTTPPAAPRTMSPSTTPRSLITPPSSTTPPLPAPATTPPASAPPSTAPLTTTTTPATPPLATTPPSTTPPSTTLPSTTPPSITLPATTAPSITPPATTAPSAPPASLASRTSIMLPLATSVPLAAAPLSSSSTPYSTSLTPPSTTAAVVLSSAPVLPPKPVARASLAAAELLDASSLDSSESDLVSAPSSLATEHRGFESALDLWDFEDVNIHDNNSNKNNNNNKSNPGSKCSSQNNSARNSLVSPPPIASSSSANSAARAPPPPPSTLRKAATFAATLRAKLEKPR